MIFVHLEIALPRIALFPFSGSGLTVNSYEHRRRPHNIISGISVVRYTTIRIAMSL
jgi:hypothetical protein